MIYGKPEAERQKDIKIRKCKIGFVGLGRVGLPLAATLAKAGFSVQGVDIKKDLVEKINTGINPIPDENGMEDLVKHNFLSGKMFASCDIKSVSVCDVIITAVPTLIEDEKADISAVKQVAKSLSELPLKGKVLLLQSTVPPNTTENVFQQVLEEGSGLKAGVDFGIAYSPERTQAPTVLDNLHAYPKIIGGIDGKSTAIMSAVYASFAPSIIRMTTLAAAEMTKLAENTYRDVNIAFANELALICEKYSIDVQEVIATANTQPYCHMLMPGLVGGHCIPMDPYYIIEGAEKLGASPNLIKTARKTNNSIFRYIVKRVSDNSCKKAAVLGLSFKNDIKSYETSHTLKLVSLLQEKGCEVTVHDPFLNGETFNFPVTNNLRAAVSEADCLILSTAHSDYKDIDFEEIQKLMKGNLVIDIRAAFSAKEACKNRLKYQGIGRVF